MSSIYDRLIRGHIGDLRPIALDECNVINVDVIFFGEIYSKRIEDVVACFFIFYVVFGDELFKVEDLFLAAEM